MCRRGKPICSQRAKCYRGLSNLRYPSLSFIISNAQIKLRDGEIKLRDDPLCRLAPRRHPPAPPPARSLSLPDCSVCARRLCSSLSEPYEAGLPSPPPQPSRPGLTPSRRPSITAGAAAAAGLDRLSSHRPGTPRPANITSISLAREPANKTKRRANKSLFRSPK